MTVRGDGATHHRDPRVSPVTLGLRLTLGLVLLVSAIAKAADPLAFVTALGVNHLPLPGQVAAWTLMLELIAGLLLLTGRLRRAALGATGLLLLGYWGMTLLAPGGILGCGCFGSMGPRLTAGQHVGLLAAMTLAWAALLRYGREDGPHPARPQPGVGRWKAVGRNASGWKAAAVVLLVAAATVGGAGLTRRAGPSLKAVLPFQAISVSTLDGKPFTLDATRKPVLFFAWWCPHCKNLLKGMAGMPAPGRPVLVSTFLKGRDFKEDQDRTTDALLEAGIQPGDGWTVYLDRTGAAPVGSVPTLAYLAGGRWHVESVPSVAALERAMERSRLRFRENVSP